LRTKRSAQFARKASRFLQQDPNFPALPPVEPKSRPNFADPSPLAGLASLPRVGVTIIMPAVQQHWSAPASDDTQVLPVVSEPLPPSAQHVNPLQAALERVFAEEDDLERQSRGRHVLAELKALPSPDEELAAAERRVVTAMVTGVPQVKNPAMRLAVRMFREARDMARARERWQDEANARIDRAFKALDAFKAKYAEWDSHWDKVAKALDSTDAAKGAAALTTSYDEGGTQLTLGLVDEISHMIAQRALTGSAASQ
jgi:hypothetical protein